MKPEFQPKSQANLLDHRQFALDRIPGGHPHPLGSIYSGTKPADVQAHWRPPGEHARPVYREPMLSAYVFRSLDRQTKNYSSRKPPSIVIDSHLASISASSLLYGPVWQ